MEAVKKLLTNILGTKIIYPYTLEECVKDRNGKSLSDKLTGLVTVDTEMSDTSTNPVQNMIIKKYVDDKFEEVVGVINSKNIFGGDYITISNSVVAFTEEDLVTKEYSDVTDTIEIIENTYSEL